MISFRYHLVSIIAVFAALAVGIIAGSTVVKQSLLDSTKQNLERTERQLADMNDTNNQLTELVDRYEQFGEAAPERFLAGRLSGTPLLIVEGPGVADGVRNGIDDASAAAGAVVAGRVVLDASIDDDDAQQRLADALEAAHGGSRAVARRARSTGGPRDHRLRCGHLVGALGGVGRRGGRAGDDHRPADGDDGARSRCLRPGRRHCVTLECRRIDLGIDREHRRRLVDRGAASRRYRAGDDPTRSGLRAEQASRLHPLRPARRRQPRSGA